MAGIRRVSDLGTRGAVNIVDGSIQTADIANNAVTQAKLDTAVPLSGMRNVLINGDFKIWQRGTSFAAPSNTAYTADRWATIWGSAARTYSRQAGFANAQYCLRVARNSGSTDTGNNGIAQAMETASTIPFQGKTMTLSFDARCGANYSAVSSQLGVYVYIGTGTDQSVSTWYNPGWTGSSAVLSSVATLTTTAQKFSYTFAMPANATQMIVYMNSSCTGTAGANDYYEITNVQLEQGSQTTPFEQRPIGVELALCQRYYWRYVGQSGGYNRIPSTGGSYSGTSWQGVVAFPLTMRTTPSSIEASGIGCTDNVSFDSAAFSSVVLNSGNSHAGAAFLQCTGGSGITNGGGQILILRGGATAYLGLSAEL